MQIDQIIKRIDWFEEQRRKDIGKIVALEERIVVLEGDVSAARQQVKETSSEVTRLSALLARIEQFENSLGKHRVEFNRSLDDIEKRRAEREREIDEVRRVQMEGINKHLGDLRKSLEPIPDLQGGMKSRIDEEYKLSRQIEELKQQIVEVKREDEDWTRSLRLLEEGRRQDTKRLTDLQGEVFALRKRADEHRGRLDLSTDSVRKIEVRVSEVAAADRDRRQRINDFVERHSLADVDRDRKWKEWQTRFESIENQAMELESHMQSLHTAQRDIRRLQEEVDASIGRADRRINEITEMQRLAEDRFRQEWVTFKADDQKRWTNYALTQDEQTREASRQQTKFHENITELEERIQELHDTTSQIDEQTQKRIQSMLALARDWVADYDRAFGRAR